MGLLGEYAIRVKDIEAYFGILSFVDSVETYKGKYVLDESNGANKILIDREAQKSMRALAFVILYNAIESTMSNCIQFVFDSINDDGLRYFDLSAEIRRLWLTGKCNDKIENRSKIKNIAYEIIDGINDSPINIDKMPNTSGNLDMRKIIELSKTIGVNLGDIPNVRQVGRVLLSIKEKRNKLAHGNVSFSGIGSLVTISELVVAKDTVLTFLKYVIEKYQDYVKNKNYKLSGCTM